VSPGRATGTARLILSPNQFQRIQPGDILVTRGIDPAWTPIYGRLSGLVMETGGQLSHGAVVAREYGLPAVAAIAGITAAELEGARLIVDGSTGTVTRASQDWPQTS
jgi:pyruvate,water dikinase